MYTGRATVTFQDGEVLNVYIKDFYMAQPFDGPMELTVRCAVLPDDLGVLAEPVPVGSSTRRLITLE